MFGRKSNKARIMDAEARIGDLEREIKWLKQVNDLCHEKHLALECLVDALSEDLNNVGNSLQVNVPHVHAVGSQTVQVSLHDAVKAMATLLRLGWKPEEPAEIVRLDQDA